MRKFVAITPARWEELKNTADYEDTTQYLLDGSIRTLALPGGLYIKAWAQTFKYKPTEYMERVVTLAKQRVK